MNIEEARIGRLRSIFAQSATRPSKDVELDIGDDAAVLAPSLGREVLSVDAHVEGVHFVRGWLTMRQIGARAATAALSDLAAMGAEPRVVLLSLGIPPDVGEDALDALALGVRDACDEVGARVVGGNLARAGELSLHTTVVGRMSEAPILRSGAKVGHGVYVTGTLGASALGLAALSSGRAEEPLYAPFAERWRRPRARVSEGRRLVELASAAIDVSDGLVLDLARLANASDVGIELTLTELPKERGFEEAARALGRDPLSLALRGGEDYELAFTAPESIALSRIATRIGVVVPQRGLRATGPDGASIEVVGFDHFGR